MNGGGFELFLKVDDNLLKDLFEGLAPVFSHSAQITLNSSYEGLGAFKKFYVAQGLFHNSTSDMFHPDIWRGI